ncbi:MAG: hypothetical protein ACJ74U_08090 [Jatrophihabitantaceae bacterium]
MRRTRYGRLAERFGPRCVCGTPRRRIRRLTRLAIRRALTGFAWNGLTSTNRSAQLLEPVGSWCAGLTSEVPCCARLLRRYRDPASGGLSTPPP